MVLERLEQLEKRLNTSQKEISSEQVRIVSVSDIYSNWNAKVNMYFAEYFFFNYILKPLARNEKCYFIFNGWFNNKHFWMNITYKLKWFTVLVTNLLLLTFLASQFLQHDCTMMYIYESQSCEGKDFFFKLAFYENVF